MNILIAEDEQVVGVSLLSVCQKFKMDLRLETA
ncbi:hypothetical protein Desgi_1530 [Desulfoscipio gibsoniae DSM 7213]|uniref:Uncharacterized protein n=1 Tax=Desulfoscipio gibsoniae DSM 7213 TaxID=767817 RepID=R4KHA7_9FIRM|nr:hypothetical protein Desgi_1530 [Desulfoscipio gibsoniae DSM 7213]